MSGKTVLVIDADIASRNFVARTLQKQQHTVVQVDNGKEGLITAWRDRPHLIIIEPNLSDLKGEELAAKLRHDPRTAATPLVALSSDPTAQRMKSCREAGFNEFIVKSGDAVPSLLEALDRLLGEGDPARQQGGFLAAFLGAKGGTGTSSLCANLAMNIALNQPELRVVVADFVLPVGSIAQIVGYDGPHNLLTATDLESGAASVAFFRNNLTLLTDWRFHVLAGSPDPESAIHLQVERLRDIVFDLKRAYDFVLIDLGRSLARFSLGVIQAADLAALVIGTDVSSVVMTKLYIEYLRSKGIKDSALYPILNRAIGLEGLSKPDVEKSLKIEIKSAFPYLGSHFPMANNQHVPYSVKFPSDTADMVFRECAQMMTAAARRHRQG
ncbi:MAG: AAA family ATPase [Chloroflexota bacterium]